MSCGPKAWAGARAAQRITANHFFALPAAHHVGNDSISQSHETVILNAQAQGESFAHFWEAMFGSGRAVNTVREEYRNDLRRMRRATEMKYVRFHGIFHDDNGVYDEDAEGRPNYNFSYVDEIFDGLLKLGVRPFVELGFMPKKLAGTKDQHSFWDKPFNGPPKSWEKWDGLIEAFARHLVDRYGVEEISKWYFEVWNEPNIDFWMGNPRWETYFELYRHSALTLKRISPRLRVGGPATAQAAWVGRFIERCVKEGVPFDFVSTHAYGNDTAQNIFGTAEVIPQEEMIARAVSKVHEEVKSSARPEIPIIWSEFNASYLNDREVTDSAYMGPWIANTIRLAHGMTHIMSPWTFTDRGFDEQGPLQEPFYGGYGAISAIGVPKPAFNAYKLLHRLGDSLIPTQSESVLATRRPDGVLAIAAWNLAPAARRDAPSKTLRLKLRGVAPDAAVRIRRVDPRKGSALPAYVKMGEPRYPTRQQIVRLNRAARLPPVQVTRLKQGELEMTLPAHGLALIEVKNPAEAFMTKVARRERGFYRPGVAYDAGTGMTFDGHPIDFHTGRLRGQAHDWSAASKESLHLILLIKALQGDHHARLALTSDVNSILFVLERKIASYEKFDEEYPGFGGFLPWYQIKGQRVIPLDRWAQRVPALDNGQLAWSLYFAANALNDLGHQALARRYQAALDRMKQNVVSIFFDPKAGKLRGEARLLKSNHLPPAENAYASGSYFLEDAYEGLLMVHFADLFGDWTGREAGRESLWAQHRRKLVTYEGGGERIAVEQPWVGSSHEQWGFLVLPFLDVPLAKQLFENMQRVRTIDAASRGWPGLRSATHRPVEGNRSSSYLGSLGIERFGNKKSPQLRIFAPYAAFPLALADRELFVTWFKKMLEMPGMWGPYGIGESFNFSGSKRAPLLTWDGKALPLIAWMGGISSDIRTWLTRDGLYQRFRERVMADYMSLPQFFAQIQPPIQ